MNRLILLNHETGTFFEGFSADEIIPIIEQEVDNGADLENIKLYLAKDLQINTMEVTTTKYYLGQKK